MNSPATILLVADDPTSLKLAADALQREGHSVLRAGGAEEAQEVLKLLLPDLILMDLQMPRMDGWTLTRRLKADPAYQHIPILALTSVAMKGDDQEALAAGCNGTIPKPIDPGKLSVQVAEILQRIAAPKTKGT